MGRYTLTILHCRNRNPFRKELTILFPVPDLPFPIAIICKRFPECTKKRLVMFS